jgi:CDP-alcohol phosphatidyltransferase
MAGAPKPRETDELVDLLIHRPLAAGVVALLRPTPISPNQVTLLSALAGIGSGIAVWRAPGHPASLLWGAGLLLLSVVLDCSDGHLARVRGQSSTYGAILDGIADYTVGVALAIGASHFMAASFGTGAYWLLGLLGAGSAVAHAALFDHTKTRYIALVGQGYREREENLDQIRENRARAREERRWTDVLLLRVYESYARAQQAALGLPQARDPAAYREAHRWRMRLWSFLGIGTHFALAYLAMLAAFWWAPAVTGFFLVVLVPLNLLLGGLLLTEPREARA